jgi:hypothetical protein
MKDGKYTAQECFSGGRVPDTAGHAFHHDTVLNEDWIILSQLEQWGIEV